MPDTTQAPSPFGRIQTKSLREHAHEALRTAIIGGTLGHGQRLNERELADSFGISTSPLKDALRRLETEGLVRIEPRKGTVVTYGPKQAEEMSLARAALESVITRQAAIHGTEAQFDQLRARIEQMRAAAHSANGDELIALNESFHDAIHAASGCPYLCQLQRAQRMYDHATRVTVLTDAETRRNSFLEHQAIMQAITARDADRAERLMREHIVNAGKQHISLVFNTSD